MTFLDLLFNRFLIYLKKEDAINSANENCQIEGEQDASTKIESAPFASCPILDHLFETFLVHGMLDVRKHC